MIVTTTETVDFSHREVREARRGDPDGLLRRYAPRNDSLNFKGRWYYTDGYGYKRCLYPC
jgi:hypothetical protein